MDGLCGGYKEIALWDDQRTLVGASEHCHQRCGKSLLAVCRNNLKRTNEVSRAAFRPQREGEAFAPDWRWLAAFDVAMYSDRSCCARAASCEVGDASALVHAGLSEPLGAVVMLFTRPLTGASRLATAKGACCGIASDPRVRHWELTVGAKAAKKGAYRGVGFGVLIEAAELVVGLGVRLL